MPHILTVRLNPAVDLFTEVHETRIGHDFRFVLPGPALTQASDMQRFFAQTQATPRQPLEDSA